VTTNYIDQRSDDPACRRLPRSDVTPVDGVTLGGGGGARAPFDARPFIPLAPVAG
jgi:hypothetical protein